MTDDNNTEPVDQAGESTSGEDSDLVKDLRKQIVNLNRDLKSVPSRSEVEAEVLAAVAKKQAIESQLTALNLPTGLSETVEGKLGDAEVTLEKVTEVIVALGFPQPKEAEGGETPPTQQVANDLAAITTLGAQVATAASQQTTDTVTEKINQAQTPAEVAQIMREAGLGQ